jgi:hypothetical protein
MGYRAPSAEEFYRYALRLDGRPRLTDRFGFSIVLVNDSSAVCRDFLRSYCIDLCQRTADRIRFVFFSELPRPQVEAVVADLSSGRRDHRRGLLRTILDLLGGGEPYDLEREPWSSLRPDSLRPLRQLDEIETHLSRQLDTTTAMPGAGEAMAFAQRLGIGRHVPCVLIITEVGENRVHVLPVADRSPAEIFDRLRRWIDDFYEQNRTAIDHWEAVEQQIENLARGARLTLSEIREWRDQQISVWQQLSAIATAIATVESGNSERLRALSRAYARDHVAPPRLRNLLLDLTHQLTEMERRRVEQHQLEQAAAAALATAETPEALLLKLERWSRRLAEKHVVIPALSQAMAELRDRLSRSPAAVADLRIEIETWWRRRAQLQLPPPHFKSERSEWAHLLDAAARGHAYSALLAAIRQLPLSTDPAAGAGAVLDAIANDFQLDPRSKSWLAATALYRDLVESHLRDLLDGMPGWLLVHGAHLTFEQALPSPKELRRRPPPSLFAARPGLRAVFAAALARVEPQAAAHLAEENSIAAAWRERALEQLRGPAVSDTDEWRDAFEDALAELRQLRREVEEKANTAFASFYRREWPGQERSALAAALDRALDEYETVTRSIRFPHLADPLLLEVKLTMPITMAARVDPAAEPNPASSLRSSLDTVRAADDAEALAAQARRDALAARPLARLTAALRSALTQERLAILVTAAAPGTTTDLESTVGRAVDDHRVLQLLHSLSEPELAALSHSLTGNDPDTDPRPVSGRLASEQAVMAALGLYTVSPEEPPEEAARRLRAKIEADEFDVFLAHNARDKPDPRHSRPAAWCQHRTRPDGDLGGPGRAPDGPFPERPGRRACLCQSGVGDHRRAAVVACLICAGGEFPARSHSRCKRRHRGSPTLAASNTMGPLLGQGCPQNETAKGQCTPDVVIEVEPDRRVQLCPWARSFSTSGCGPTSRRISSTRASRRWRSASISSWWSQ